MIIVHYLLLFLLALFILYSAAAFFHTWRFFDGAKKEMMRANKLERSPPMSIIKPLAGKTIEMIDNIASFCNQNYPSHEIILAASEDASGIDRVFRELRSRFPDQDIKQATVKDNLGPNHKVGNLIQGVQTAQYETVVISDSDMRVDRNYLRALAAALDNENVGVVTCLYRAATVNNWVEALQALTLDTAFTPNVLLDRGMQGLTYGFGATLCTSKQMIQQAGGLEPLLAFLADDYQLANRIHAQGYDIALCSYLPDHISNDRTFKAYVEHQLRWAITQRVCRPWGYLASLVTHGVFLALLNLILGAFSKTALFLFIFVILIRIVGFIGLHAKRMGHFEIPSFFWLIPFNDMLNTLLWILSLFKNTVKWQRRRYRVFRDGRMTKLS